MARHPQHPTSAGSQKWLQLLVNDCPELLSQQLAQESTDLSGPISWLSPLRVDEFSEYNDKHFIDLLGIRLD